MEREWAKALDPEKGYNVSVAIEIEWEGIIFLGKGDITYRPASFDVTYTKSNPQSGMQVTSTKTFRNP